MKNYLEHINFKLLFDPVLDFFYPTACISCDRTIKGAVDLFCIECQYQVKPLDMHHFEKNAFTSHFENKLDIIAGAALFLYTKGGRIQQAMEALKYKNRPEIGIRIGLFYGNLLKESTFFHDIDLILPVPLHYKRKALRGYNQSYMFAQGLSDSMGVNCSDKIIKRVSETSTQTVKSRMERLHNMQSVFQIVNPEKLINRRVLLVDDILTTGATLESCGRELAKIEGLKLSLATIAMGW